MVLVLDGCSFYYADIVNQVFRFVVGIWLHRKRRQILFFRKMTELHSKCAPCP